MAVPTLSSQPGTQLSRSIDKVLEDAQVLGYVNLSGRKLKDFPVLSKKDEHELADTVEVDLTKNRFSEVPREICEYIWLEKLNCYSNVIKYLPEEIVKWRALIYLNLSRNQLTTLPVHIGQLPSLEVLIVRNNKLVSLPEEIGNLEQLMDLDVSCNEISTLPSQLANLKKLRSLNVRRNHLISLPDELHKSHLVHLDVSCNKITAIPPSYRQIVTLESLVLEDNPLSLPPPQVCRGGRLHIFKYLSQQAAKEDKKRGILEQQDMKVRYRRSLQNSGSVSEDYSFQSPPPGELRRHNIIADSGYLTANGDKRWSASEQSNEEDEARILADRASQQKELRQEREKELRRQISDRAKRAAHENHIDYIDNGEGLLGDRDFGTSPNADEFARGIFEELERQTTGWKMQDEKLRLQEEEEREREERRRAAKMIHQNQERILQEQIRDRSRKPLKSNSFNENMKKGPSLDRNSSQSSQNQQSPQKNAKVVNHKNDDVRKQRENLKSDARHQAQLARRHSEEAKQKTKQMQKEAVLKFVKNRSSSSSLQGIEDQDGRLSPESDHSNSTTPTNSYNSTNMPMLKPRTAFTISSKQSLDDINPKYTMRREMERVREEMEQLDQLRRIIESRLKVMLPDDLPAALMDGVVLCHLANNIRPHAISSIHVPSPAVPKLTMAKCRRNVDNFIDACRRIGVSHDKICSAADIIEEKSPLKLGITVQALVSKTHKQTSAV